MSHVMVTENLQKLIKYVFEHYWWHLYFASKLTALCVNLIVSSYFFMNLIHSLDVWLFGIRHLLTHYIYLTLSWHLLDFLIFFAILTFDISLKPPQPGTGLFFNLILNNYVHGIFNCDNYDFRYTEKLFCIIMWQKRFVYLFISSAIIEYMQLWNNASWLIF